jgi:bifunctional ADP-heptose synthase (sugar kinase/adenylyltransferase)
MLEAIRYVDEVRIFNEDNPCRILDEIKPAYHVKSRTGYKGLEKETVERNGGVIVLIDNIGDYSTTSELEKIKMLGIMGNNPNA